MDAPDGIKLELDPLLWGNATTKNGSIVWPWAIDARLDYLVSLVAQRYRTDRRELAAAILLAAEDDPDHLGRVVEAYRTATARDALRHTNEAQAGKTFIDLPRHKPGPRPRARQLDPAVAASKKSRSARK